MQYRCIRDLLKCQNVMHAEKKVRPDELSEKFNCPKCNTEKIWRSEECKGKSKKYQCNICGYKGH